MDSLHLFTIPKWLPDTIPLELWAIILSWKWRLEMKDIHKEFYLKMKDYSTLVAGPPTWGWIPERRLAPPLSDIWIRTHYLWSKRGSFYGTKWGIEVRVAPKCGYKHLNDMKRPRINGFVLHNGDQYQS